MSYKHLEISDSETAAAVMTTLDKLCIINMAKDTKQVPAVEWN
jgi:hypothetical protein